MDKELITSSLKRLVADRQLLSLVVFLGIATVIYSSIIGFSIHVSDVTVYSRYTAFGEAHFYKSHWQYLLSFLLFGLVVFIGHAALMTKLHDLGRRQTAFIIGWAGIVILLIACIYATGVLSLGRAA